MHPFKVLCCIAGFHENILSSFEVNCCLSLIFLCRVKQTRMTNPVVCMLCNTNFQSDTPYRFGNCEKVNEQRRQIMQIVKLSKLSFEQCERMHEWFPNKAFKTANRILSKIKELLGITTSA